MTAVELAKLAEADGDEPSGLSKCGLALWLAKAGRWDASHDLTNEIPDPNGAWIHAYLHREEGDLGNASYWYHRAGREMPARSVSLDDEWHAIASALDLTESA